VVSVLSIKITKYDKLLRTLLLKKQKYTCQRCKTKYSEVRSECQGLHVSHYYGRGNWLTRLDFNNVDLHCHGCHAYLGGNPHMFKEWKFDALGEAEYSMLVLKANSTFKDFFGFKKAVYLEQWHEWAKDETKKIKALGDDYDINDIMNPL